MFLLTAKPVVYLVNLSERDYIRQKNKYLPKIAEWIKANSPGSPVIPISVSFEDRLTRFDTDEEAAEECKKLGTKSILPKVIVTMRKALDLGSFFTTGTDEVRQWTLRNGTKAPQAAGVIHGDFEKTFIQAVVYNYNVLREEGDEATVKAKGKIMTKGKWEEIRGHSRSLLTLKQARTTLFRTAISFSSRQELQSHRVLRVEGAWSAYRCLSKTDISAKSSLRNMIMPPI